MDRQSVLALMTGSRTEAEWDENVKRVEVICGGLPSYWQKDVVEADLKTKTLHPTAGRNLHQHMVKWDEDHPDRRR